MIVCPRCGHENLSGNLTAKELEINKIICRGCYTVLDHNGKVIERLKHIYWIDRWCREKHENYLEIKQGGLVVYDYKLRKYDNDERWRVYQGDDTKELTSFVIPKFELKKEYEGVLTEEGLAISMVQMICAGDYLCKKEMMTDEEKEEEKIQRELEQISFLEFAKKYAEYEKIDGEISNDKQNFDTRRTFKNND